MWVEQLKKGDETAAYNLYQAYSSNMYNTLIRITGDSDLSQDLLQEAFIKAFNAIDSYRQKSSFGSWLKRIVVNTALEQIRRKKLDFTPIEEDVVQEIDEELSLNPKVIHEHIKKLPEGCRTVLSLFLFEDFSHKEIAEKLNISESTSKTQYQRAKSLLRIKLSKAYYER